MIDWMLAVLALFFAQSLLPSALRYGLAQEVDWGDALRARDRPPAMPVIGARLERARLNMIEALAVFTPLALAVEVVAPESALAAQGAMIFFWARLAYAPAYALAAPGLRSAIWLVGHGGLALMAVALASSAV